jgi:excisionase family DNA binding protein
VNAEPELLRVSEVARRLGVSRRVIYSFIARGTLPGVVRVGRAVYVRRRALELWLSGRDGAVGSNEGDEPAAGAGNRGGEATAAGGVPWKG